MNRAELDILAWFAAEQRPVGHLLVMPDASAWVRAHGGRARHLDAYCRLVNALRYRLMADLPADVLRLDAARWRRPQRSDTTDRNPPEAA